MGKHLLEVRGPHRQCQAATYDKVTATCSAGCTCDHATLERISVKKDYAWHLVQLVPVCLHQ